MRTKVFQSGNSQAVRIPFDFRFDVDTVEILQGQNGDVILRPVKLQADMEFLALFSDFDDDFIQALEDRDISAPQERDDLYA
ncbi:Antitoxin VapB1 [Actinobacillus ureae]|uniref:antitoxin n=1 Tax=Actinobacillus ureae TaxID=723 RepID=UPI000E1660B7|nr:antitoxin [Actinobacillus ureae]SUT87903.1 Antitoxin VapB1 [Actinobacillus ureae]SUU49687.1 Antitoxin VapB1 [Actinobacillus ureae]